MNNYKTLHFSLDNAFTIPKSFFNNYETEGPLPDISEIVLSDSENFSSNYHIEDNDPEEKYRGHDVRSWYVIDIRFTPKVLGDLTCDVVIEFNEPGEDLDPIKFTVHGVGVESSE